MKFSSVTPHLFSFVVSGLAVGCLFLSTGCGKGKAAAANSVAPQSLSEPIRPSENESSTPPAIPVSNNDEYAVQRTGQSRELPTYIPPNSNSVAPAASVATAPTSGKDKVHTLAKGETIYALSRQYNVKVKDILAVNTFKDPSKLSVGTKVVIPN